MLVSRLAIQSYPDLQGEGNPNFFMNTTQRDSYFAGQTIKVGQYCAIGGDPNSTDWSEPVWEIHQFNGVNWAVVDLSQNFALVVTNDGIAALSNTEEGMYKVKISRILVKSTGASLGDNLASWDINTFFNSNGPTDVCLDTRNEINTTFTLENNLKCRTNLLNGGLQFTALFGLNCLGQSSPNMNAQVTPILSEFDIAMVGLCVQDQRTNNAGQDVLFAVANLPTPVHKTASTPGKVGNDLKLYLNTTLSNFGNVANIKNIESSVGSVPEVTDEGDLVNTYDGENSPYNLYIVDNLAGTNIPAIAIRKGSPVSPTNPISWSYLTPTDDTLSITDTTLIDSTLKSYMIAGWNGSKYVPADSKKKITQEALSGLFTKHEANQGLIYAGKVTNSNTRYSYSFTPDTSIARNYKVGDIVSCVVADVNDPSKTNTFTFKITRVTDETGIPLEFVGYPSVGNLKTSTTGYVVTVPYGDSPVTGENFKIQVTAVENDSVTWNFPLSWYNKPLYVDYNHTNVTEWNTYKLNLPEDERNNPDRRGLLTIVYNEYTSTHFVGWCLNNNSIRLALDLRNEATYTNYGTTRYATYAETVNTNANQDAYETTSIVPRNLKRNYLQITLPDTSESTADSNLTNDGSTRAKAIKVDTYTKFTKTIECTGTDLDGVAFKGTAYRAMWADLAEYYQSDKIYPAGTLICIGAGLKEITEAKVECNGIISTKPGYQLGEKNNEYDLPVALVGKVPVLFDGECMPKFGDRIYLSSVLPGRASTVPNGKCLGKIIDKNKNLDRMSTIMCSVRIDF